MKRINQLVNSASSQVKAGNLIAEAQVSHFSKLGLRLLGYQSGDWKPPHKDVALQRLYFIAAPTKASCRQASYKTIETVLDKFKLRLAACIGKYKHRSEPSSANTVAGKPRVSGPNKKASSG